MRSAVELALVATDLDQARDIGERTFYPHGLALAPDGYKERFALRLSEVVLSDEVGIGVLGYGTSVQLNCGRLETGYQINVPLLGRVTSTCGTQQVSGHPGCGTVFAPVQRSSIDHWAGGTLQLGVRLSQRCVDDAMSRLRRAGGTPTFNHEFDLTDQARRAWVDFVIDSLRLSSLLPEAGRATLGASLARSIATGFLCVADHDQRDLVDGNNRPIGRKVLDHAVSLVEEAGAEPLDVAGLAETCGVSVRTLQYEFARHLGTTISQFRRQMMIERAHLDLKAADPADTTVAEIAARWGFFHQGRFASAYRQRFGSLPSVALKSTSL